MQMDNILVLMAVLLLTVSQVLQKIGADRRLRDAHTAREWLAGLLSPELVLAGLLIAAGTALWLSVLYRMDVSRAFPFLSLSSVLVVALSRIWLRDRVTRVRWVGIALISVGVALVAGT